MAGRLRRRDDDDGGVRGPWEVRLNDNGVRLVQASVDVPMSAFLEAKDLARREAALALWTDVDVHEPEFCAPFFMQVRSSTFFFFLRALCVSKPSGTLVVGVKPS